MGILIVLALSSPLLAQRVSPGIRSGVMGTSLLHVRQPALGSASPFTFGPCLEFHLWRGAALGIEFLLRQTELATSPGQTARIRFWEAPGTFVYRFDRPLEPFFRAGMSVNRVFDIDGATACARGPFGERFYCLDHTVVAELRHRSTPGFVLGGGLRLRWGRLKLDPEVRLNRWFDRDFGVRDAAVRSNLNQVGFLLGVLF